MYKLYCQDGSEKTVETNTDRKEHIASGFYFAEKPQGLVPEIKDEPLEKKSCSVSDEKKNYSKPNKRKGI